jgi:ribonuclease D
MMNKVIYNKYDKRKISGLPRELFGGRIIVVITPQEAKKAVDYLMTYSLLGFDTETRPSFKKGKQNLVSLIQVSTLDTCFLFRINMMGITSDILRLLEDTSIPKIGVSVHDDILSLHKRVGFTPGIFIDLQELVRKIGVEDMSLQKLYANIMGKKISKTQQLSNWEANILTEKQKLYASTDAWACLILYNEILRLYETNDYTIVREPESPAEE